METNEPKLQPQKIFAGEIEGPIIVKMAAKFSVTVESLVREYVDLDVEAAFMVIEEAVEMARQMIASRQEKAAKQNKAQ